MRYKFFFFCLWMTFFSTGFADLVSDTIYLTWKRSPSTTMTIQWISLNEQLENRVLYRHKNETEWHEVRGHATRFPQTLNYLIHQVEILSLQPDTTYVFRLYGQAKEYLFKTMPINLKEPIKFVVGGDMYHDEVEFLCATSRQAALFNPSFAIVGGDIAYASRSKAHQEQKVDRWIKWIECWHHDMVTPQGYLIPVIAAVGNHDVSGNYNQTPAQARIFSELFPMPGKQIYDVLDFGTYLSIFLMDSGHANPVAGKQVDWLQASLNERKNTKHLFATYHVPAYCSVRPNTGEVSQAIRKFWVPCFESGGIQAAFEHHDHAYKRTHPLLNDKIDSRGIIYLGDGAWGVKKPRKPRNGRLKRPYIAKFSAERHFIGVIVEEDQQTFISVSDTGQMIDKYVRKR